LGLDPSHPPLHDTRLHTFFTCIPHISLTLFPALIRGSRTSHVYAPSHVRTCNAPSRILTCTHGCFISQMHEARHSGDWVMRLHRMCDVPSPILECVTHLHTFSRVTRLRTFLRVTRLHTVTCLHTVMRLRTLSRVTRLPRHIHTCDVPHSFVTSDAPSHILTCDLHTFF